MDGWKVSNATTTSVVHPTMTMPLLARFPFSIPLQTLNPTKPNTRLRSPWPVFLLIQTGSISSLKVAWRKDRLLDSAIERDKRWRLCARVVREVLNEPGHAIPLRYLEKRRERLHLPVKVKTFLSRYPNLFDLYPDRIKPKTEPVPFLRPSPRLRSFLALEASLRARQEPLVLAKLCKLLMMSRDRVIPAEKLLNVKRDFGFPDDLLTSLVPKYPHLLRLVGSPGEGRSFLELVSWNEEYAKSVIEQRADEEARLTGVRMRPNFIVRLPPGFYLKKEMREWVRDWLELPYISPYADASGRHPASPEMEKRMVAVLHEVLSLSLLKRVAVPVLGKFCGEYRFSNAFANTFTRHSGIFYVSLKGGIKTAMLREAYDQGELVDRDPLLEIRDKFVEMMEEGYNEYMERLSTKREAMQKDLELMAKRNAELSEDDNSERL
ncbi:protein WHAT'S THIS FACTOR 1, chloroplastic [Phoenix dactylifera]|uniref:Protein WHAT'S THIS FACTOR 1, chloroplastic n=1 Tax=Phoenix dactylifera TaxID=42345 RepID=A0A8B8J611_PHODC|nr:protein WHAT'S THIS FACTOR 1, chloroplastic [Phoenix dactylifera]XP_017698951.1 protein WHAT'S THIS FACTOR 1, chloroplastic [Phoenix dactylifera]XP_026661434.1 protein WHAT'S THIS FACTOR 1, chloroplastic [Phoenix dactylifera]XP_026661435.1 protein WHAT'S THIS FACTOR 1, chloroplastic [Phoenix dactylifera]XP_026661436.1 protein WHAT'S THIS FACTOR 1, chloroplastic [Phoenix dactylifera]XP_026661437.1 protein WHAT'S THIS FACTOR 1, chloroplastic [Phoenix dactylifera]XP_038988845.1 protein WHAT'S